MYDARLINLNRIMHHIPWKERKAIILKLNACRESKTPWGENLGYKKQSLMYEIYRMVQGEPLTFPLLPSLAEERDIKNRQLSEQIIRGINGYLLAPLEKQRAFQRNLLNPWTVKNIFARLKSQRSF